MGKPRLFIAVCLLVFSTPVLGSDVVKLRGGGSVRGLILDHRATDDSIKLRTGRDELPILRVAIERIDLDPDPDNRYWLAREYFEETAAGFYELALWCDANELNDERDEHLNDVLQLDTDHAEARKGLGFIRHGRDWLLGQPSVQKVERAVDGTVVSAVARRAERTEKLRGRQETLRKQQEIDQTVAGIATRLDSTNAAHVRQARAELAEIHDPLAIGPLTKAMQRANVDTRVRLLHAIGDIAVPEASYALAIAAAVDLAPEVRVTAIDLMQARPQDHDRFVPVLEQALRSEKAGLVHNAAEALESLGQHKSVPHLINALTTPTRPVPKHNGTLTAESQSNWVPGLKLTDVWASTNSVPVRAPS
jgi:hypothetical protein